MRVAVLVFPGTNCEHDILHAYSTLFGAECYEVWHRETDLKTPDLVIVPGGFSFGDYLRTGALAKISPVMESVKAYASAGGRVLGICNGFQILCETGLLPGALLSNTRRRFLSRFVHVSVESTQSVFTSQFEAGEVFSCPISHFEGNYFIDPEGLRSLQKNNQILFKYCASNGIVSDEDAEANPNGSMCSIAGICNEARNVAGLMPHPERSVQNITADRFGTGGAKLFTSLMQ